MRVQAVLCFEVPVVNSIRHCGVVVLACFIASCICVVVSIIVVICSLCVLLYLSVCAVCLCLTVLVNCLLNAFAICVGEVIVFSFSFGLCFVC